MRCKTWVSLLTALSCMTASVASVVYPVNADILTVVDLTKEQTLALYGTSIQGRYYTGSEWRSCTFDYYASSTDFVSESDFSSGIKTSLGSYDFWGKYTTSQVDSLYSQNEFLLYRCPILSPDATTANHVQFDLVFSTDIQGIAYFRQIIGFSINRASSYPYWGNKGSTAQVSYSPSPVAFSGLYQSGNFDVAYAQMAVQSVSGTALDSQSGVNVPINRFSEFSFFDIYLQDIDSQTGQENTFSLSGQTSDYNKSISSFMWYNPVESSETSGYGGQYYILALSTPRVTDGYIIPQPETTAPDYSGQLSDIYDGIGANTTLLQAILAKLDLIYQQMQANGLPSPTLTPAQTIPPTLQQYYSGIASGAPSVSAVNGAIGGASDFVPLGIILSSSGLGSLLGVLAGLCCAGWVLTRGRSG